MDGMGEVEDVMITVAVRILDIVCQAITKVDVVATKKYGLSFNTGTFSEFNLEAARKLFLLREVLIEEAEIVFLVRPPTRRLLNVGLRCILELHLGLSSDRDQ